MRGDKKISYGEVMDVMGAVHRAGFTRVALITELSKTDSGRKKPRKRGAR